MALWKKRHSSMGDLATDLAEIIRLLSMPVSEMEAQQGWDAAMKQKWLAWYNDFDRNVGAASGASRAMDFDGAGRSDIARLASRIGNHLSDR